jgi:hypothetical protein
MIRGRGEHRTASIRSGVDFTGAGLLDTGMIAGSGLGIILAAHEPPGKIDTIAGYVDHSVSIGEGAYSRHLTITSTGTIMPSAGGAAGVYIPAKAVGGSILNMGVIVGGPENAAEYGGIGVSVAAHGASITNDGQISGRSGGYGGVGIEIAASGVIITNDGQISGGSGAGYRGGAGISVDAQGANITNDERIFGGYGYYGGAGIDVTNYSATVTNDGLIAGAASRYFAGNGIDLALGGTIANSGTIVGGSNTGLPRFGYGGTAGVGVDFAGGGMLSNLGIIEGGAGGYSYVSYIATTGGVGVDFTSNGTLNNAGIIGGGNGGAGTYANGSGATAIIFAGGGTLINSGIIVGGSPGSAYRVLGGGGGGGSGLEVLAGGMIINTGTIAGANGAYGKMSGGGGGDGIFLDGGTLVNAGAISGGAAGGAHQARHVGQAGDAVQFGSEAATLIVDPGAIFIGQVGANATDTLVFGGTGNGTLTGIGTQFIGFGTLTEVAGAQWTLIGTNTLGAGSTFRDAGVLSFLGTLTNKGAMDVAGGTLSLLGTTTNDGTIEAATGFVTSMYGVGGTGTLEIGATGTLSLQNGALAGQTVDFLAGTGLLGLGHPLSFFGEIEGFRAGDVIDLTKPSGLTETGYSYADGVLTIMDGSATVASLHFEGSYATSDFSVGSDGHGGLYLTFA